MERKEAERLAREAKQYAETAVMEIAYGDVENGPSPDDLYNEADCLYDLLGDKLYDLTGGDKKKMKQVAEVLLENAHRALEKALKKLIKGWR